ncbi:PaaX family transcriptional regulator [Actinoplanes xinjiangensis]|uniref:PaaX family transcriptional regulator n=1 Tax=Actinoplanes xinjiangensis TaxID=512350 RepID=A0A316EVQ6_9ACTN|nr:PaaX family transcriptional regulator C-terminal domain-containing protein [Actinoplanes xinjiangensis]PWK36102.1 PaaX family transcriptional regulator [Actinoplanes xinjiangensis]
MDYPFEIEEIFTGDASGSLQLPRRQAGSSPQGLALTLLADYTAYTEAWLPSGALVALLAEADVSAAGARTAISRLARRSVLQSDRVGRSTFYRLAPSVAAHLRGGGRGVVAFGEDAEKWDGWWTLVAFSVPQEGYAQRRALRNHLRWRGFAPLYDALWVSPRQLEDEDRANLAEVNLQDLTVFRARHTELAVGSGRSPIDAWDLHAVSEQYETFVRHWSEILPRVRAGAFGGAQAVRARTAVMDSYRRFAPMDPPLPMRLLPGGWPREHARLIFAAVYDGLAETAERHVRAIVADFTATPPRIHANTVADLSAGRVADSVPDFH